MGYRLYVFKQYLKSVFFTAILFTFVPILTFALTYNTIIYIWNSFGWSLGIAITFSFIAFVVNIFIISEMDKDYVLDDAIKFSALGKEEWKKQKYNKDFENLIK